MTLDGKSTKTKVIDLHENYIFVVDEFFFILRSSNVLKVWLKFPQFEIQIGQTTSDSETTNIKVVDFD
jgi:hypothetical protein